MNFSLWEVLKWSIQTIYLLQVYSNFQKMVLRQGPKWKQFIEKWPPEGLGKGEKAVLNSCHHCDILRCSSQNLGEWNRKSLNVITPDAWGCSSIYSGTLPCNWPRAALSGINSWIFPACSAERRETVLRQGGHHLQVLKNKHTGILGSEPTVLAVCSKAKCLWL